MSIENVKRFYDTIATDIDFRHRIIEANKKYSGYALNEFDLEKLMAEEFLPLLKEEGYYFTIDELVTYQNEYIKTNSALNDTELENVSGGINREQAIRHLLDNIFSI